MKFTMVALLALVNSQGIMETRLALEELEKALSKHPRNLLLLSTYEQWDSDAAYTGGNQVVYNGGLYTAKWWT